ncbi:hypothetical protein Syun_025885 [Stephania yunnanensis]|uniref:Uncharacterized protein n=1 Tax=Stephania yunnanensis TaxID=152371 RepID=A0AAP0EV48_9MAGN
MARILATLVVLLFLTSVQGEYMKYKDSKHPMNVRIRDLMDRMTLKEKVGQKTQIDRAAATAEIMKSYSIEVLINPYELDK